MKYLFYNNYCSGRSGLSNGIMSIEVGVILAHLMDRVLVLDGDVSPPANVVEYGARVDNSQPSRVSDLIDFPVPWVPAERVDLTGLDSLELCDQPQMESVFVHPPEFDTDTSDFSFFAQGRQNVLRNDREVQRATVVRLSGGPEVGDGRHRLHNLCFYSYYFYLDAGTRSRVHRLLRAMKAKAPYQDLADQITRDLGPFNAVHIRRGDFKNTLGTTTLDRKPEEVIQLLDHHFARDSKIAIATDEMEDPFFAPILEFYPKAFFLDELILDAYGPQFDALPKHDSIALAYLSQLVAAESEDFVGSMASTYTSIIQRYRGNRGKQEHFKFLWNEVPDPGVEVERGRHPVSDCIPLDRGIMVEESSGPYSWNRYNPRLNPAWMREWPEAILGSEPSRATARPRVQNESPRPSPPPNMIRVEIGLSGGQRHTVELDKDSELLRKLFRALVAGAQPPPRPDPVFFEIPLDGGRSACSFSSTHLVSVVTEPPVLVQEPPEVVQK